MIKRDPEVTLAQFFDSRWFRGLARLAMFITMGASAYAGVILGNINSEIGKIKLEQAAQAGRLAAQQVDIDNVARIQTAFTTQLGVMAEGVADLSIDLTTIKVAIGEINGKLGALTSRPANFHPVADAAGAVDAIKFPLDF